MSCLVRSILAFALANTLAGCTDRVEGGDGGEDGGDGGTGEDGSESGDTTESDSEDDGANETGSGDDGLPEGFCDEACSAIADETCWPPEMCTEHCEAEAGGWTPEVGEAFTACVAETPLCFITVEDCMLGQLHEEGREYEIRLTGSDLLAFEGQVVRVWHDPDVTPQFDGEAVIEEGEFAFEWSEPINVPGGPLLLMYVDLDGDGGCDPDVDLTASQHAEWDGDFLEPSFAAHIEPPVGPAGFVCNFLP